MQVPGVALLATSAQVAQPDPRPVLRRRDLLGAPKHLVESPVTPVQLVWPLVGGESVLDAVEDEPRRPDAIGVPTDRGAEVGGLSQIPLQAVIAQRHVVQVPVAVRDDYGDEDRSEARDPGPQALGTGQCIYENLLPLRRPSKRFRVNVHRSMLLPCQPLDCGPESAFDTV